MNKSFLYFCSLLIAVIVILFFKFYFGFSNNNSIHLSNSNSILKKADVEILNGCGEEGVAKLYTNFLRDLNYDVVSIENAKDKYGKNNFDHEYSKIIINKKNKLRAAYEMSLKIGIDKENIKKNYDSEYTWDLVLIIGKDYNKLNSYLKIKNNYNSF
tara:strand:+ start:111 stop:581 length:471 start_codon:yes stop_codon:yes gene_type:complete